MTDTSNVQLVQTPVLSIGYEEHGNAAGFPIILLHGFPYDIRSFDGVVPPLVEAGYRVLVPYLRGYGATRFLDPTAPRMAEQAAIGQDVVDFAEALGIKQCALAGYDWPGNLRELRNVIERAVILAGDGPVTADDLHLPAQRREVTVDAAGTISETEERMIRDALEKAGGNKSKAARLLGITRRALYGRLERYGIDGE